MQVFANFILLQNIYLLLSLFVLDTIFKNTIRFFKKKKFFRLFRNLNLIVLFYKIISCISCLQKLLLIQYLQKEFIIYNITFLQYLN